LISDKDKLRFWGKVAKSENGCWLWTAARKSNFAYGHFRIGRQIHAAHRVAYAITYNWPLEWHGYGSRTNILHRCDNPSCVNPSHLFAGTHTDNMRDMYAKGRRKPAAGDRHGSRVKPERRARGDRNGMRIHPESVCRGEINGNAKLSNSDAIEILRRIGRGECQSHIARDFGVSPDLISKMRHGKVWGHLSVGPIVAERERAAA